MNIVSAVDQLRLPAAVLWDMDGTLVDSDRFWADAEQQLYMQYAPDQSSAAGNSIPPEVSRALEGASLPECARVLRESGVNLPAWEIIEQLVSAAETSLTSQPIPWANGALDLLRKLAALHIDSVLVTGSPMRIVRHVLAAAPAETFGSDNVFAITGDSPLPAKPAPDRYLAAACMAQADIRDCVIFEDSSTGLASALAAGAGAVYALTALTRSPAKADARYQCIQDFQGIAVQALLR